jgi:hypothetical protein
VEGRLSATWLFSHTADRSKCGKSEDTFMSVRIKHNNQVYIMKKQDKLKPEI